MITYEIKNSLYINLTNKCTNNCCFCIRNHPEGLGYDLWLEKEPSAGEVTDSIINPAEYEEIVFCGYGEPLVRLREVVEISKHLKKSGARVRINTNGQANLIWGRNVVPEFRGLIDSISISLNAKDAEEYQKICKPDYGESAYASILDFSRECMKYIPEVCLSVVDIIPAYDIEVCRKIAVEIGAGFRVRHYY
ncbi:MAG: TatD family nuclease-associated radical SAM protein [Caulobacteraceae bacterium]